MEVIDIEKEYKDQMLHIWKKHCDIDKLKDFEYRKSPILPKFIKKNSILFIGINPSFSKNDVILPENKEIEFYPIKNENEKDIPYFEKFKEIAKYCNHSWSHLDLFFLRETNQKVLEDLAKNKNQLSFLEDQLDVSFKIIEEVTPKIIVVANAFASEFFGKKKKQHHKFDRIWKGYPLDFETDFDDKIGTYYIEIGQNKTPILFSGMLSGQRALDIGSLERLKWQIKFILEQKDFTTN